MHVVPALSPPEATVSVSVPAFSAHVPSLLVNTSAGLDVTASVPSTVCVPVRPVMVMVEPAAMSTDPVMLTVIVLLDDTSGLLWPTPPS